MRECSNIGFSLHGNPQCYNSLQLRCGVCCRLLERFVDHGSFADLSVTYEPATKLYQTVPATCFYLLITAAVLSHPTSRKWYTLVGTLGTMSGVTWMFFH